MSGKFDGKAEAAAVNLSNKMESSDFFLSFHLHHLCGEIHTEDKEDDRSIHSTACGLQRIKEDSMAMDDLTEGRTQFIDKLGGNAHAEFNHKHWTKWRLARIGLIQ